MTGDIRYALRSLGKAPVFTAVAVLSLALGIGANTAVFGIVDDTLIRKLPVHNPGELVQLREVGMHYGNNTGLNAPSPIPSMRISATRIRSSAGCSAVTRSR